MRSSPLPLLPLLLLLRVALLCGVGPAGAFSPPALTSAPERRPPTALLAGKGAPPPPPPPNPNRRKALAALVIWPLLAVGDDIYISQVQPRLAERGVDTPNLPYAREPVLPPAARGGGK